MASTTETHLIIDQILETYNRKLVVATPLGLGKPVAFLNALYQRAKADSTIDLKICTALTLEKPKGKNWIEERFLGPIRERVFANCPDLDYEIDRVKGEMPRNIEIIEFYYPPGKFIKNARAQRNYVSSNYTHVARDMADRRVNVLALLVSKGKVAGEAKLSLSCNADVTFDLMGLLSAQNQKFTSIAQINQNLPFMYGDAIFDSKSIDFVIDDQSQYFTLFGPPKMSVSEQDHMIGIHVSTLIRDDGELQIGIGSLGDAVVNALVMRQENNQLYNQLLKSLDVQEKYGHLIDRIGGKDKFERGLFGATEMMVDGYQHLFESKILKKKCYDHIGLQRLLNEGKISERFDSSILKILHQERIISWPITREDFDFLEYWGVIRENLRFSEGRIMMEDESIAGEDLKEALGTELRRGHLMHAGFFLGPQSFYYWLRMLPEGVRSAFAMKSVQKINQLYGHEEIDRLHRKNARFVNSCLMTTLSGAHVSDGLDKGRVLSGIGGQFNFVAMAQELPDGHSILMMRSTRIEGGRLRSNIVSEYGHQSVPRHMRDILVTEYGAAFLRGKTDEEIICELIKVSDSRFQEQLVNTAKKWGKLRDDYEIPAIYRKNTIENLRKKIDVQIREQFFRPFPFGTDFTDQELRLGKVLKGIKSDLGGGFLKKLKILADVAFGLFKRSGVQDDLARLGLDRPGNVREKIVRALIVSRLTKK